MEDIIKFTIDDIEWISIELHNKEGLFRDNKKHEARVFFKNGDKDGTQNFYSDDVNKLMDKIKHFTENL